MSEPTDTTPAAPPPAHLGEILHDPKGDFEPGTLPAWMSKREDGTFSMRGATSAPTIEERLRACAARMGGIENLERLVAAARVGL